MSLRNGSGAAAVRTAEPREICEPARPPILHTEHLPEFQSAALEGARLFYEIAMPTIDLDRWLRAHGVDLPTALLRAGPICECPIIRYSLSRTFQLAEDDEPGATPAVVHVVTGADAETPIGLVAWCRDRPADVFTYPMGLPALGLDQLDNPASYFGGRALHVHRAPLGWLAAGCVGIAPLDLDALGDLLAALPARHESYALAVESVEHGYALQTERPLPQHVRLVVPRRGAAA
jgi:hypothetical protein